MVKPVCDIYPPERFMQEAEEEWDQLKAVIDPNNPDYIRPREGYDNRYLKWSSRQLKALLPMNLEQGLRYVTDGTGWFQLDPKKTKKRGRAVYRSVMNDGGAKEGEVSAVLKDVILSGARGTKSLAAEFQMKVRNGQNAMAEGVALAKSLRTLGTLGEMILGLDQGYGRGMRAQMLRKRRPVNYGSGTTTFANAQEVQEVAVDKMTEIGQMLSNPDQMPEAIDELMKIADMVMYVNDPMAIGKAGLGLNMTSSMWKEMFMNGLLSSPDTYGANMSGAAWVPMRALAQGLGAQMIRPVMNAIEPGAGDRLAVASMGKINAMYMGFGDAARLGIKAFLNNRFMYTDPDMTATRSITGRNVEALLNQDDMGQGFRDVVDGVGTLINVPSRSLMGIDEFAKHLALRGEVAERAIMKAYDRGEDLQDLAKLKEIYTEEFEDAFMIDPESGSKWFYSPAYDTASAIEGKAVSNSVREGVFQEPLGENFQNVADAIPDFLRPMIPFIRTPMNILKQGIKQTSIVGPMLHVGGAVKNNIRTPSKIIMDLQQRMLLNPADTARITGQISLMSAVGGMLYSQAMSGNVTGGGPGRFMDGAEGRKAQQAWEKNNIPYSFKIGDQSFAMQRLPEPMATLMKIYADMAMTSAYVTAAEREDMFAMVTSVAVSGIYQSSMLTGLDQMISIFTGGLDDVDRRSAAAVQRYVATQVPMSGALAYLDRGIDPYKSAYQEPSWNAFFSGFAEQFGNGVFGKVADRFPGAGANRPLQIDQIGGEPIPIYPGVGPTGINPMLAGFPLVPRKSPSDPAWQAVYEIGMGWTDYKPNGYKLTPGEQARLNTVMGNIQLNGKTLRQAIMEYRRQPEVDAFVRNKGGVLEGQATAVERGLNRIKRQYGQAALQQLSGGNVSILQRAALSQELRNARNASDVGRIRDLQGQMEDLLQRAERGY